MNNQSINQSIKRHALVCRQLFLLITFIFTSIAPGCCGCRCNFCPLAGGSCPAALRFLSRHSAWPKQRIALNLSNETQMGWNKHKRIYRFREFKEFLLLMTELESILIKHNSSILWPVFSSHLSFVSLRSLKYNEVENSPAPIRSDAIHYKQIKRKQ